MVDEKYEGLMHFHFNNIEWKLAIAGMVFLSVALLPYKIGLSITRLFIISLPLPFAMLFLLKGKRNSKNRFLPI